MRRIPLFALLLVAAAAPARAGAHVGAVIAKADFLHPAPPAQKTGDGGVTYSYVPEEADASFTISWNDGDVDPTAKFTFYYLDHGFSDAVSADQVEAIGTLVRDAKGRAAADIYAGCTCQDDPQAGIVCPVIPDGGTRWCDNSFAWDTSQVPAGAYWIVAVNNDPPYHVYNPSLAPVRVAHGGGKKPPVAIVLRPDGLGAADQSYRVALLAAGTGAVTIDLAYGTNDLAKVLGPTTSLAKGLPATAGSDGAVSWIWDTSQIPNGTYFVRATLHDDTGLATYSDSRYGVAVYHAKPLDGGVPVVDAAMPAPDLARPPVTTQPGSCAATRGRGAPAPFAVLAAVTAAIAWPWLRRLSRRRGPRRGSRSA